MAEATVSTVSWHIMKHKRGAANSLQRHNERVEEMRHSNENIKPELSKDNINLKPGMEGTYIQRIDRRLEEAYRGKQKPKSNSNYVVGHTVQLGGLMKNQPREKWIEVLTECRNYIAWRYNEKNVIGAQIHLDETNPHLHMDIIPLTPDGRLSSRVLYSRSSLRFFQQSLLKHLQDKYPELGFDRQPDDQKETKDGLSKEQYVRSRKKIKALEEREQNVADKEQEQLKKELELNNRDIAIQEGETALRRSITALKKKQDKLEEEKKTYKESVKEEVREELRTEYREKANAAYIKKVEELKKMVAAPARREGRQLPPSFFALKQKGEEEKDWQPDF